MNKKDQRQLQALEKCERGLISVPQLREALKVSKSGLGDRLVSLLRKKHKDTIKDEV